MEARLPCRHFERSINWHLNQVLRAGLEVAARMTGDHDLRRSVYRVAGAFGDAERKARLDTGDIDKATRGLSRLTAASAPALRIIRLLSDMLGVAIEPSGAPSRMPGFLFDMNIFFSGSSHVFCAITSQAVPFKMKRRSATYLPTPPTPIPGASAHQHLDRTLHCSTAMPSAALWMQNTGTFGSGGSLPTGSTSFRSTHSPRQPA